MNYLPYGRQIIDQEDIDSVVKVLQSNWLTTGPAVEDFEQQICLFTGAKHAVAVCNGTAALHAAMHALGIGPGDEVIVPAISFVATANCVLYCNATPVFADVLPNTLLIDPESVASKINSRTKAIIAVDYAGQPCDWFSLHSIAQKHELKLVADSCHALGAEYHGQKVGTLADITVFSFHPVKHITTGEGGMCVTNDASLAQTIRTFRNHGISLDARQRETTGSWHYEMTELGYNYRITDIQCALGSSQLKKMPAWIKKRNDLAHAYNTHLAGTAFTPLEVGSNILHAYHLYVVHVPEEERESCFQFLRNQGVGVNVHYIPIYLHPYYQKKLAVNKCLCPVAEQAYKEIITLPLWPGMDIKDVDFVSSLLKAKDWISCK